MNRVTIGALCVAACVLSVVERRALGAFALEQVEHVFDVMEGVFHLP
jgi:hypothetical protein